MAERPIEILHQDQRLLFARKPPRVLTVAAPDGTATKKGVPLLDRLRKEGHTAHAVHRLDYETSGVCVFAKDAEMMEALIDIFRRREVEKTYRAVCLGIIESRQGEINAPILDLGAQARVSPRGKSALTRYSVLGTHGPCTEVRVRPITGRHNQIRLHFAHVGHPLVGERKYARGRDTEITHRRVMLHAETIRLRPPHLAHDLKVSAPLPEDWQNAIAKIQEFPVERRRHRPSPASRKRRR